MNSITRWGIATVLSMSLLLPAVTQAAGLTTVQVNSIINLLQSFNVDAKTISTVEAVLTHTNENSGGDNQNWTGATSTWAGSSTPPGGTPPGQVGKMMCITLNRNLRIGSQGDDVKNLQRLLSQDQTTGFTAGTTGYFGPMTARAMMQYQMHNGIASSTNGSVGPLTRGFFERNCGKGLGNGEGQEGNGQGDNTMMAGSFTGLISALNGMSITVQNSQNVSRVVTITSSTTIQVFAGTSTPPTSGSISDLIVGKGVTVQGVPNQDGSITALMIRVGMIPPPMPMMYGGEH